MSPSEQARADASHPCDACGGSGLDAAAVKRYRDKWEWPGIPGYMKPDPHFPLCPVCGGSGRISDVMPAADAVADAETLRSVTRSIHRGFAFHNTDVYLSASCALFHVEAATRPGSLYEGDFWIRSAAEHAFKAVPGLRDDQ
jgi:hypothetical protein